MYYYYYEENLGLKPTLLEDAENVIWTNIFFPSKNHFEKMQKLQ